MSGVVFIDASPQLARLLGEMELPSGTQIHQGDPLPAQLHDLLAQARVVMNGHTYMTAEDLCAAPLLERIVFLGTGASSYIDLDAASARGVRVDTIRGYGDQSVAQHSIALALAALRRIVPMDRAIRGGIWQPLAGAEFQDLTFGIVGLGGTGQATAALARALGFRVIGWNRTLLPETVCPQLPLEDLLAQVDILSLHLALTPETEGLLGSAQFARMQPGTILVNTARAGLIDTEAMVASLQDGRLAHAALDVFDTEPLPQDDPLTRLPNVTLTSHAAFKTDAAARRLLRAALELID